MSFKKFMFLVVLVCSLVLVTLAVYLREWGVEKNVEYKMRTAIYIEKDDALKNERVINNVETMTLGHRSFQYTSTWQKAGETEYLYVTGDITPIWGAYAYMSIEKQVVTDGLRTLLSELGVPIILDRQLELSEGSTSYVRLLKNDSSGMCFYHYDNNSLFCFGLR
ncbi:hypothetical protein [Pseudomonas sp. WMBT8]|uniref:hypothetical protein n=1 Tax=Pseudomonas sp. WMBT8 TaxID=3414496 RepID=UPI003D802A8D